MQKIISLLTLALSLGCASASDEPPPADAAPTSDAYIGGQLPTDAYKAPSLDLARVSDTFKIDGRNAAPSPDSTIAPPVDTRPQDTQSAVMSPDAKPATPRYVNDAGWSPDPANQGACCLPCDSVYQGCRNLVQTTPWCNLTVGGTCYKGGKAGGVTLQTGSVWPSCLPLRADGKCDSAGSGN